MQSSSANITLAGLDDKKYGSLRFLSHFHGEQRKGTKPHHAFRNWSRFFQLPWFCFLDIAVFCLYFLFASYHQNSSISFAHAINHAITEYFLDDVEITEAPIGIPIGKGQIFFIDDFLSISDQTNIKFFNFSKRFPITYPILGSSNTKMSILLQNDTVEDFSLTEFDVPSILVYPYLDYFSTISISMVYHIQIESQIQDSRLALEITITFSKDPRTETIFMNLRHTRFQEKYSISASTILNMLNYSIPIIIMILNFIAIFTLFHNVKNLIKYTKIKAFDVGLKAKDMFKSKFDNWNIFAFISHFYSILASITYLIKGQDIEEEVPPVLYIMALATFLHSILLIRYLSLKESTILVINVLFKATIILLQFLLGCLPIFAGFWAFGICFFGHLSIEFASPMQCASYLFCVMHGDSILGFYDSTIIQNDYSVYLGFFYSSIWLAFALLLMFNVTISIVQDVLKDERAKLEEKHSGSGTNQRVNPLPADLHFTLNQSLI
ncbi:hypothetical protein TRFO_13280 [Tritrichomonas foetus]|uniref:Polycystin cation channel PKD1/PKD2 domain-containing protein n=1 Tax=Tritrichomonas foetus TaxID=1144522 RepID=A0A1J4KYE1_9EUKA|nr:hypothetical protein TRFO_13280 [Tritrichomonas foetus]|eukprot:OHT16275.1 hypothetical protein TRFO_13280 [Tritrichomonas foetus]